MVYLLIRFWRQFLFAILADIAAAIWFKDNGTINILTFAAAFVLAEAVHLVNLWWRRKRGLPAQKRWEAVALTVVFCTLPGVAIGFGLLAGKHFPSDSGSKAAAGPPKPPRPHVTVDDQTDADRDGDLTFSVFFDRASRIRVAAHKALRPAPGDALILADVLLETTDATQGPFCRRGYGALLIDSAGRRFETIASENRVKPSGALGIPGSFVCDALASNAAAWEQLAFQVPAADRVAGIAVWNSAEPADKLGRTYVFFRASNHSPVPTLGTTAWGPARDH